MISVLLSVFNAEDYIERAIDSILAQTYSDFELLIINDGSTDGTKALVENYNDPRIFFIDLPQNVGLINALNYGLDLAERKYIARMDADDICLPNRFEKQVAFLEDNPDYVACGSSIINFNETTESYMRYPETHEQIKVALHFFERNICHPTVMIRKSAMDDHNIRYRKNYAYAEDYSLWFDLIKVGKLHNLKQGLLKYYRHQDQVSAKYYPEQIELSKRIVTEQLRHAWPTLSDMHLERVLRLCVHEQGAYPDQHFPLKKVNETIRWLIVHNKNELIFEPFHLRKLLYFKKFRCSFYYLYPFNYVTKLRCFLDYLRIEPSRALSEVLSMTKLLYLKKMKKM